MSPVGYVTMIEGKSKASKSVLRLELVRYARRQGIREAARAFRCSRNTVRKWVRRLEEEGVRGLKDRSRGPGRIPHKTSRYHENRVIEARKAVPCYGAGRLKEMFGLRPSEGAIGRILRQNGLTRKPRKKYRKKRDLRAEKSRYRALTHHQADVKYLQDIARYWPQMKALGLPEYQYTIRDTKSGALFLSYADGISVKYAELAVERYLRHLRAHGVKAREVTFQTDRGAEFSGTKRKKADRGFTYTVEEVWKARHVFIPPGCANANADVESSHALIEHEFFDLEGFKCREDFLRKAAIYQHYFNFARINRYKGGRTPWEIVKEDRPKISPEVLNLPPVFLNEEFKKHYLPQRNSRAGHHVPATPAPWFFEFDKIFVLC